MLTLQHERDTCRQNSLTFLAKFLSATLLGVSAGYCQRALVGESGIIIPEMGKHDRSVIVEVHGTHCALQPHKQK